MGRNYYIPKQTTFSRPSTRNCIYSCWKRSIFESFEIHVFPYFDFFHVKSTPHSEQSTMYLRSILFIFCRIICKAPKNQVFRHLLEMCKRPQKTLILSTSTWRYKTVQRYFIAVRNWTNRFIWKYSCYKTTVEKNHNVDCRGSNLWQKICFFTLLDVFLIVPVCQNEVFEDWKFSTKVYFSSVTEFSITRFTFFQ